MTKLANGLTKQQNAIKTILLIVANGIEAAGRPRKRPGKPREGVRTLEGSFLHATRLVYAPKATKSRAKHDAIALFVKEMGGYPGITTLTNIDNGESDTREVVRALRRAAKKVGQKTA